MPCGCSGAKEGRTGNGHLWMLCLACEDNGQGRKTFYYEPAHFGAEDRLPGAVMRRDGPGGWVSVPVEARRLPLPPGAPEPKIIRNG